MRSKLISVETGIVGRDTLRIGDESDFVCR